MKPFVLMNRRTGDLMVGCRVCFMDQIEELTDIKGGIDLKTVWQVGLIEHHGWVIDTGGQVNAFFLNRYGEKFFEVLGEL